MKGIGRRANQVVGLVLLVLSSACAAGIRTGIDEPIAPISPLPITEMAIMPVSTELGSEGIRTDMALTLQEVLRERFPWIAFLGPEDAAVRLASSHAARDYADLLADFDRTGVVDSERLVMVTRALGTDYFLQVRASYRSEDFLDPLLFSFDEFDTENRQVMVLVARVWDEQGPGPLWEAVVRTTSETDDFQEEVRGIDELILRTVENLADQIPLGRPEEWRP